MAINHPAVAALKARFPEVSFKGSDFKGEVQIVVPRDHLAAGVQFLKEDPALLARLCQ